MARSSKHQLESYPDLAYSAVGQLVAAIVAQSLPELDGPGDTEVEALDKTVRKLELRLGSAKVEVYSKGDPAREVGIDTYPGSVITEIYDAGIAFSKAVARAYVYFDALQAHKTPEALKVPRKPPGFAKLIEWDLWEHIEIGYFRAAAFWDRIGQLLDFVFFNVRDYREGFAATIKKLKTNFDAENLPFPPLRQSPDWKFLRNFESNAHGMLTSKRNILAHRRAFREATVRKPTDSEAKIIFVPFSDHLDTAATKFSDAPEELNFLRSHAKTIWRGEASAFSVSLWWLENRP